MTRRRQRIEKLFFEYVAKPVLEFRVLHQCMTDDPDEARIMHRNLIVGYFEKGKPATWACGNCGVYCEAGVLRSPQGIRTGRDG